MRRRGNAISLLTDRNHHERKRREEHLSCFINSHRETTARGGGKKGASEGERGGTLFRLTRSVLCDAVEGGEKGNELGEGEEVFDELMRRGTSPIRKKKGA